MIVSEECKKEPHVTVVHRKVYVVGGFEYKTEREARDAAAFEKIDEIKTSLANAIIYSDNPPKLGNAGSIASWLLDNFDHIRDFFSRTEKIKADVLIIPLKEGCEP